MSQESAKRIRQIYGIALSLVLAAAGICLMAACVGIYRSGDQPFSREAVAAAFGPIAVPVYLCLAMVVVGFVLELILPAVKEKNAVQKQRGLILQRLQEKVDMDICGPTLKNDIMAQRKKRKTLALITSIALVLGSVIFLGYALNPHSFHQSDFNGSMIRAMWVLIPCMAVPFGLGIYSVYAGHASMDAEIALLKQAPKADHSQKKASAPAKKPNILGCAVLLVAVAAIVFGYFTGGTVDVLTKAVNICTECVGLG